MIAAAQWAVILACLFGFLVLCVFGVVQIVGAVL